MKGRTISKPCSVASTCHSPIDRSFYIVSVKSSQKYSRNLRKTLACIKSMMLLTTLQNWKSTPLMAKRKSSSCIERVQPVHLVPTGRKFLQFIENTASPLLSAAAWKPVAICWSAQKRQKKNPLAQLHTVRAEQCPATKPSAGGTERR